MIGRWGPDQAELADRERREEQATRDALGLLVQRHGPGAVAQAFGVSMNGPTGLAGVIAGWAPLPPALAEQVRRGAAAKALADWERQRRSAT